MQIPNRNLFTAPALKRWDKIPTSIQAKLLSNVWCEACSKAVYILVESGRIQNNDLILTGRCADCGGRVARLIEGDWRHRIIEPTEAHSKHQCPKEASSLKPIAL